MAPGAVAAAVTRPAPFDLVRDEHLPKNEQVDLNGIFRNPVWGFQANHYDPAKPYEFANPDTPEFRCFDPHGAFVRPECVSPKPVSQQPFCDLPSGLFHPAICSLGGKCRIRGHMNWAPTTYEGAIVWDQEAIDQDYDLLLYPPRQAGLTVASCTQRQKAIGIEFDSREVMEQIGNEDPEFWWNELRAAVSNPDDAKSKSLFDEMKGKHTILTGLMNLDCEHGCTAELHPVWAMAIHLRDSPSDDVWVILVRNWGDEGFCSSEQHYLEDLRSNRFSFRLPWRNQATAVEVNTQSSKFYSFKVPIPRVTFQVNEAAYVKFDLPAPKERAFTIGELHLKWPDSQEGPVHPVGPIDSSCPVVSAAAAPTSAEDRIADVKRRMNQDKEKLDRYKRNLPQAVAAAAATTRQQISAATPEPTPPVAAEQPPTTRSEPDKPKVTRDDAEFAALCAAYNNNIPGLPNACKKNKKQQR